MPLSAQDVIRLLDLAPLPREGGYFRETYRSGIQLPGADPRSLSTAIHYLLTPDTISALHRLPGDEIFHFHLGDPVEMLQLRADGTTARIVIGTDIANGMRPQVVVPGGTWQGTRLLPGGAFALMGTTMAPGFDPRDFELGRRAELLGRHPDQAGLIRALTREAND
jgi:hypothetical protein